MPTSNISRVVKKFFLSAFVVLSFAAYAIQQHQAIPDIQNPTAADPPKTETSQQVAEPFRPTATLPIPSSTPDGLYKNGSFTGPKVDVYYGLVQVSAVIQNGRIADVQFLEFPNDRRTSQLINSQAMPWLQQEAIQSQSANVNIITGATLTSEGFIMSLQSALQTAQN